MQNYHEVFSKLPPASIKPTVDLVSLQRGESTAADVTTQANWLVLLLPQLGEDALAAVFNLQLPIWDPSNNQARCAQVKWATCPSDSYNRLDNQYAGRASSNTSALYARGNYAINGGSGSTKLYPGTTCYPEPTGIVVESRGDVVSWWGTGVAGINKSFSFDDFTNRLSTTVMLDEIRAGIAPVDSRGVWSLGEIGSSITFAHGIYGDDIQPNNRSPKADDIVGCAELYEVAGEAKLLDERMGCAPHVGAFQATARSMHPGGVNLLMADGAVHFAVDDIDQNVWHMIHSRLSQEDLSTDSFTRELEPVDQDRTFLPAEGVTLTTADVSGPAQNAEDISNPVTNSIGMRLVRIPTGEFIMGLPDTGSRASLERPEHIVRITKPFHIGITEVTQRQFAEVMGNSPSWHSVDGGGSPLVSNVNTNDFPVEQVSWYEADEFCRRLTGRIEEKEAGRTYRLPTEAEWEYVCREGSSNRFISCYDCGTGENGGGPDGQRFPALPIAEVAEYPANAFGVHDMRGNVWEWVSDWYDRDYYRNSPRNDPQGPSSGAARVVRGTDWVFKSHNCMLPTCQTAPELSSQFIGFRVACVINGN